MSAASIASSRPPRTAAMDPKADPQTGNGSNPKCMPAQLGCCRTAPFRPHLVKRAERRSTSLDALEAVTV
jgi:hypothetical protein